MSFFPSFLLSFLFFSFLVSAQQNRNPSFFNSSDFPWQPTQNRTLYSPDSVFAAGFSPVSGSPNLYRFSIWYLSVTGKSVVWSASKTPVNRSGAVNFTSTGVLRLGNSSSGDNLWPGKTSGNSSATRLVLHDNGNLVFGSWESFKFPTDTILPNQTITGTDIVSENGKFKFVNSTYLYFNNSDLYWTASGTNAFKVMSSDGKVDQENGASFITSDFGIENRKRRLTLDDDGNLRLYGFDPDLREWTVVWYATHELCTIHGTCGPSAICTGDGSNSTSCICPPGFSPLRNSGYAKEGCEIKTPIRDLPNSRFIRLDYVNYTSPKELELDGKNLSICQANCTANRNCLGFLFKYDGKGTCILKLGQLLNGYWSPGTESAMFLRVDQSETANSTFKGMTEILETTCPIRIELPLPPDDSNTTTRNIVIICTLFAAELISGALFFWAFLKKYIKYRDMARTLGLELLPAGGPKRFSYAELKAATGDFSNLIGKGGFGDVYKGELADHRVVAVKCLKNVAGGEPDFWAEVTIIARMHHLNLVRLWGFCAEKGQRIVVYEYVPNGSLDKYLFPSGRVGSDRYEEKPMLDWGVRYRIALGVARAIAYLHEECLEWVLHCDIKPENILLGDDFCPKISDFGLSKLRKKEDMVSLSKIRGTRGYMAPEWVKSDMITAKADVYSFGMVLLELVSGVRNNQMQGSMIESEDWYFPGWAFDKVYKEVNVEDILDRQIKQSYDSRAHFDMVNRMVKTAMWCLQSRPEMRPSMGKVAKMLEGTVEITEPTKPTIFFLGDE